MKLIKYPQTEEEQLEIVKKDPALIRHMDGDPSEQVQLEAVKKDGWLIYFIHNPSIELQNLYLSYCLKHNLDVHQKYIKDLNPIHIQNLIDCKNLIQ